MRQIEIFHTPNDLAKAVSDKFIQSGRQAIHARGRFTIVLAGGSTPKSAYQLIASQANDSILDWQHVHIFWGDERCVPPDHKDSNYQMAYSNLLKNVPIPESNIHRIKGELEPFIAAASYDEELRTFLGFEPQLDMVLLGMGNDGHTASLFPGSAAIHEKKTWAIANYIDKLSSWRITLTPALLNLADQIVFMVTGEQKAMVLKDVLEGKYQPDVYPSQIVKPIKGELTWLIEQAVAKYLKG